MKNYSLTDLITIRANLKIKADEITKKVKQVDQALIHILAQHTVGDLVTDLYGDTWQITRMAIEEQHPRVFVVYYGRRFGYSNDLLPTEHLMMHTPFTPVEKQY